MEKGCILKFSMESTDYEHDHGHDYGGVVKMLQTLKEMLKWWGKMDISYILV